MGKMRRRNPGAWGRFPKRRPPDPEATPEEQADEQDRFEAELADWAEHGPGDLDEDEDDDDGGEDEINNHR